MKTKQAVNPYMPSWEYVPDAEPHVVGDRVYVYGSHDIFNGLNFGQGVCFHVYCYNVQPGVEIDYATGENWAA
jgi:hypothetical protein